MPLLSTLLKNENGPPADKPRRAVSLAKGARAKGYGSVQQTTPQMVQGRPGQKPSFNNKRAPTAGGRRSQCKKPDYDMMIIDLPAKGKRPRRSHIFDRDDDDFYVEPVWCSERLFAVETFTGLIWDPAAGSGTIPRSARAAGLSNFASDIADHGCGPRQDFLTAPAPAVAFSIVTNPPFKLARAFVERALTLGAAKVAIIFPTARLNAARWLKPLPLAKIYLLTPRPSMPPGEVIARGEKPGGGKTDFCWLVFDRTHSGPPELWWLHRDDPR